MFRLAVAGAAIVLLFSVSYFLYGSIIEAHLPGFDLMPLLSAIALLVSLFAVALALRAVRHAASLKTDIVVLARSIDLTLKDISARSEKETATIGEMTISVAREIDRLSDRVAVRESQSADAQSDNVIPHPSARRSCIAAQAGDQSTRVPEAATVEAAYHKAVATGEFEVALQPIVSVSHSSATGFEVFASLQLESGQRFDLRRPATPTVSSEAAAFERILLTTALQTGRKQLGAASAAMPLHVAVSEALLADGKSLGAVLDTLQFYPELAHSFVLSLPTALFDPAAGHGQALDLLAQKGVRFAAEGWDDGADDPVIAKGVSFMKVSANRLLDRDPGRRKLTPGAAIVEQAAGDVAIVAVDVASDEDAVSLIDLGVDLMSGPRFGGPKRLKPERGGSRPGRLALI